MAKKKAARAVLKKGVGKGTKKALAKRGKQTREQVEKALKGPLRQPTLGGMPRVRNARLDKLAEAIGDCRDKANEAATDEKSFRAAALKEMHDKNISHWSHAGVDLIRVPGEDKLKVKTHKDGGSESGAGEGDGGELEPEGEGKEGAGEEGDRADADAGDFAESITQ